MENQVEQNNKTSIANGLLTNLGELFIVFLLPYIIITSMSNWSGEDPIRSMGVVATANLGMLIIIWIGLLLRKESLSSFGLTFGLLAPKEILHRFGLSLVVAVFATLGFVVGSIIMGAITGVPDGPDYSMYSFLEDNLGMLLLSLTSVYIVSSFGEEVIYRAFLINRLSVIFGNNKYGIGLAVLLSSVIFGLVHYTWGPMGIVQTGFMGLVMGICYIRLKKRLWILVLAHAYMDTVLLVQMYLAVN